MKYLTVGKLMDICKDLDKDLPVIVVSEEFEHHCLHVSSVGHLHCDYEEEKDALGIMPFYDGSNIEDETDLCDELLWDGCADMVK